MPKISIKYKKNDSYMPFYANGAVGGVNVKGEILINFYAEVLEFGDPGSVEVTESEQGDVISESPSNVSITRIISTGVIMNYERAVELHTWLGKHLEVLKTKIGK